MKNEKKNSHIGKDFVKRKPIVFEEWTRRF